MARVLQDYPWIVLKESELEGPIEFSSIFGRGGAVHVEIGSGKGTFLVNQSQAEPEVNFLGIEWASKFYRYAVDRIGRWGLRHVRMIRTDAAVFVQQYVQDSSVDCFHIYFPDPWPKKKHHKRRFINESNICQLLRCLKPGGVIQVATDHSGYFDQIERVLSDSDERFEVIDFTSPAGAQGDEWVGTNFERKYLRQDRRIYGRAVKKRA